MVSDLSNETDNVSESAKASHTGRYFHINHHGEVVINLRIRNASYNIEKNKVE